MPNRSEVLAQLKDFVARELLDGQGQELEESTPLLEWGIVNSLSLANLVGFAESRFGVKVPPEGLIPQNFQSLKHLTDLIVSLSAAGNDQRTG